MKTQQNNCNSSEASIPRLTAANAIAKHTVGDCVFIDVRDDADIEKTGIIPDALKLPRGFIELAAEGNSDCDFHALRKDAHLCLVGNSVEQTFLAGGTLRDLGYTSLVTIGAIEDWIEAGGPIVVPFETN